MQRSSGTVTVILLHETTGERLATSQIPEAQLPDSFALDTSLEVAGEKYTVVRAEPVAKADFVREGKLTLTLRKVETLDPRNILFSLPTICGAALPDTAPGRTSGGVVVLHEDDFRQVEMVSLAHAEAIGAELLAIQEIHTSHSAPSGGWKKIHVRDRVPEPLPAGLTWATVLGKIGRTDPLGAIAIGDAKALVRGAVAVSMRSGAVLWGIERKGDLRALCLQNGWLATPATVDALKRLADDLGLAIVDWCRCRVYAQGARIEGSLGDPWDDEQ